MRSPAPPDEPRFVLAARAMAASGQWLLPHRGTELYAEKPPVFMWLQAASHGLFRDWDIAFLVPSLLASLLTLWLTWDLGRRLWGQRVGRYAALSLFCTIQFGLMAKRAQIDMVLVAMTTLSLWGMVRHLLRGPDRACLFLAGFAAGLGTVTKGVGFLPLLVAFPWLILRLRDARRRIGAPAWQWTLVPIGFLAGAGVWLVPLGIALLQPHGTELDVYARDILLRQTGTRYLDSWHHVQPAWYYAQVILTLWLPGSLLLPKLVPAWMRRMRRGDARHVLLLGWALLVLAFFTATPGKREVYLFPALPAVCIAAAPLLGGLLRMRYARLALRGYVGGAGLAALALGAILLLEPALLASSLAGRDFDHDAVHAMGAWMLVLGASLVWALDAHARCPGRATVLATCLIWIVYGVGFMRVLDPFASSSRLMGQVYQRIGPVAQLGLVDWREQNYLQAPRTPVDFGFKAPVEDQWRRAFEWVGGSPAQRWILANGKTLPGCVDRAAVANAGQSNRNAWVLVPGAALAGCGRGQ
ncbi:hypothetical protein B1992_06025 [Pseudoxanthomonas broegbernensis]|uniref:Glycosyltransferase RgtA/B/C/D-like domain-containing protein n=2 Tax=Pseudoxanthomonas broegbernensis TaxID=83619 RepID=A0A7V8K7W5_9GAMM|nr:glycosyltransferase family 39 protein [Pseudoxanthomonas broegbernensis]KAF1687048.1 hypothetical protein B1992_06025 [Pseudoxanthomonas broegbernensis]